MAKRVQILGHTTSGADAFTGFIRELSVDISRMELRIHDGITPGGIRQARQDLSNTIAATTSVLGHMTPVHATELASLRTGLTTTQGELDTAEAAIAAITAAVNGLGDLADLDSVGTDEIDDGAVTAAKLAADAVTTVKILNANVTEAKLADSAVATAKIANSAVTNAKLANVATATFKGRVTAATGAVEDLSATQATSILNAFAGDSGSGALKGLVPAAAAGDAADGYVLKANGLWGRQSPVLLAEYSHAVDGTVANITFTDIPDHFSELIFQLQDLSPSTTAQLFLQLSTNNGSSWITSGYYYRVDTSEVNNNSNFAFAPSVTASGAYRGIIRIQNCGIAVYKHMNAFVHDYSPDNATTNGIVANPGIVNAARLFWSAGNNDGGAAQLWGI